MCPYEVFFFFSSRRRHTRFDCDWSSDVCSSDLPPEQVPPPQVVDALIEAVRHELAIEDRLAEAKERQAKAVQEVRGVADDYHPFDRQTGQPVTAEAVGQRLHQHVEELEHVAAAANLGAKPQQAIAKARTWVITLLGCVAWFWCLA